MEMFLQLLKDVKKNLNTQIRDKFLGQFIWNNEHSQYKNKTLSFENWIRSESLFIKHIFDENGELYNLMYFTQILVKKNNIL